MSQEERLKLLERACGLLDFRLHHDRFGWRILTSTEHTVLLNGETTFISFDDLFKRFLEEVDVFLCPIGTSPRIVKPNSFLLRVAKNNPFYSMSEEELAVKVDLDSSTALEN